jgi:hypothetical protein
VTSRPEKPPRTVPGGTVTRSFAAASCQESISTGYGAVFRSVTTRRSSFAATFEMTTGESTSTAWTAATPERNRSRRPHKASLHSPRWRGDIKEY